MRKYLVKTVLTLIILTFHAIIHAQLSGTWDKVGNKTFNGWIESIVTDKQNNLYVAGRFTDAAGKYNVEKWNGNTWSTVGDLNANNTIYSLAIDKNNNLYAAGRLWTANYEKYIAKWDGSNWTKIFFPGPYVGAIYEMIIDNNNNVYVSGDATSPDGLYYVQKWNGTSWSTVGNGLNNLPDKFALDENQNLYIAGKLRSGGKGYVAKLNGNVWTQFGNSIPQSQYGSDIQSLAVYNGYVYAGGIVSPTDSYETMRSNGGNWSSVSGSKFGYSSDFFIKSGNQLLAASTIVGVFQNDNWIQCGNTNTWQPIYNGAFNANIFSVTADLNNKIYAAGAFTDGFTANEGSIFVAQITLPQLNVKGSSNHISMQMSPNPVSDILNINSSNKFEKAEIYDTSGKIQRETKIINNKIEVKDLEKGLYIIKLYSGQEVQVGKFIKN